VLAQVDFTKPGIYKTTSRRYSASITWGKMATYTDILI